MQTIKLARNLNCGVCVSKVKPHLDDAESIDQWNVDTADTRKVLTVTGQDITKEQIAERVSAAGFKVLEEVKDTYTVAGESQRSVFSTYRPLLLVVAYILIATVISEITIGRFNIESAMAKFMGGFFLTFSFFKMLNIRAFADAFQTYDVLAARSRVFALSYPFVELVLGMAYLSGVFPLVTNAVTLGIMLIGLVGVIKALLAKKTIQCACLGTVFDLPMSKVTFVEDGVMALMAAYMVIKHISFM